jgi:magnesium-protoporphyrin O-methyltransferase
MNCCQLDAYEREFDAKEADTELRMYLERGPRRATRMLIKVLEAQGISRASLLDIGGGVGVIQHELIQAGVVSRAVDVDASTAYLNTARQEAERRQHAGQVTYLHGDFVELASQIEPADIVTLDRVICCYPDMETLVGLSLERARRFYALVFPRGEWWMRLGGRLFNLALPVLGMVVPLYIHRTAAVDAVVRGHGFERLFHGKTTIWQAIVYRRAA